MWKIIYRSITHEKFWRSLNNSLWPLDWRTSERYSLYRKDVINSFLGSIMATLRYIRAVYFCIQIGRKFWAGRLCEVLKNGSSFISSLGICSSFVQSNQICLSQNLKGLFKKQYRSKFSLSQDYFNVWQGIALWSVNENEN